MFEGGGCREHISESGVCRGDTSDDDILKAAFVGGSFLTTTF